MQAVRWRYAVASVTGTSHLRANVECQDASAINVITRADGNITVVAVSDGAGSAKRSAIGSGFAVSGIIEQASAWLSEKRVVSDISRDVICEWIKGVREQIAECAGEHEEEMRDYAATLLVAVIAPSHAAFAQIGDGVIITSSRGQDWSCVFWPMRGEYANTTYFVTDDDALDNVQFESRVGAVEEVAVLTDGLEPLVLEYAHKRAFQPFFARIFKPLRASKAYGDDKSLSEQLCAYLKSPGITAKADDDLTLVLATVRDDVPEFANAQREEVDVPGSTTVH